MYRKAILATLAAWFIGFFLDANLPFYPDTGYLCLRVLFPILALGFCILHAINNKEGDS